MVDESKSNSKTQLRNYKASLADTSDAGLISLEARRHLRKKERQLAAAQETVKNLENETYALQKKRNELASETSKLKKELVGQTTKLKKQLEQTAASRSNEYQTRVKLEKALSAERTNLAAEQLRTTKFKNAYDRLKTHPVLRLSRAVTSPAKKLVTRPEKLQAITPGTTANTSNTLSPAQTASPVVPARVPAVETAQSIMRQVGDAYRAAGNASIAKDLANKLPPKFVAGISDRVLLDQIDGVVRLLDKTPSVPEPQHGIGYVAHPDRIMYCAHSTGGFNSNGYSTRTAGLTQALVELGTDIFVAARPGYPWDAKTQGKAQSSARFETLLNGVRTVYNPGPSWSRHALDQYIHEAADIYAREAMINRPSKIVAASNHVTALPALIAARRLGIPFAYEVRGLWEVTEASGKDSYIESERYELAVKLETLVATNADHVFAITAQVKDELVRRGVQEERISLLPNAADIYEFAPLRPETTFASKYKLEGGFTLGYAGSVLAYEGLDVAIRAVAELVGNNEPVKLVIVGDGPALADLKSLTSDLEIDGSVQFVGRVPSSDVPRFIELFDAVLCPRVSSVVTEMVSPLKPLEAMSAGKPVIASNVAPLADLLGSDGSRGALFQAGDASDLANVIRGLAGDRSKRDEMGREARRWITEHRSWSTIAHQQLKGLKRTTTQTDIQPGKPLAEMTVALISDEFTRTSIQGDVKLVLPTPENWKTVITESNIDMLFVESAWEGNNGAWTRKVGYYDDEQCRELRSLIIYCRSVGIPTVFWNKEDPVHFNRFRKTAKYFDHVFTTDANCLKDYWRHRGSLLQTLASLPFWAQPDIHNPLPSGERTNHTVAYGGSYYGERFAKRSKELVKILDAAIPQGLTIYDRQFNNPDSPYVFPEHLQQFVQGGLPYSEMLKAYKNHPVHINVNSVSNSPTMFSRRVFELAGCGTPVISGPGLEIGGLFGSAIPSKLTSKSTEELVTTWMTDESARVEAAWAALRVVYRSHLSSHRLAYVMRIAGLSVEVPGLPAYIMEIDELSDETAQHILGQSHRPTEVVAKNVSSHDAARILVEAGLKVLDSAPASSKAAVANLGSTIKDPFAAEDLMTALVYSGTRTASIKVDTEVETESHRSLWQLAPADPNSATITLDHGDSAGNVSVRRVPAKPKSVVTKHNALYPDANEPLTVLVAGHDLKFAPEILAEVEAQGHTVVIDKWSGHSQHDPEQSMKLLEDADVIFCEWSLGNLAWYSKNKLPGQRLISRFHSQELFTKYPTQVDFEKVDQIAFVGEFIRRVAIRKFGIPESITTVVPNIVNLAELDLPKTEDARFNLGLVGIVPEQKRLDLALDLLATLRAEDNRYKLFIKGRRPEDYPWMSARPHEMAYYEAQYARIESDPALRGAVAFDEHGNDMAEWYQKIGIAVSVSDFESFHFTLADGAASAAVPVSLAWPGAELIYPASWLSNSIDGMSDRVLHAGRSKEMFAIEGHESQRFAQQEYSIQRTLNSVVDVITVLEQP